MSWSSNHFDRVRIVGSGIDGGIPIAAVSMGNGIPGLLHTGTRSIESLAIIDDIDQLLATVRTDDGLLLVGRRDGEVYVRSPDTPGTHPGSAEWQREPGLDDLETVIGAAGRWPYAILGYDRDSNIRSWVQTRSSGFTSTRTSGLKGADIDVMMMSGARFIAGGSRCDESICTAAAWRSEDGITWSDGQGMGHRPGRVTGLTARDKALYAVGTLDPGFGQSWLSLDAGRTWDEEVAAGLDERLDITVLAISNNDTERWVELDVAGQRVELREGGILATTLGDISVPALGDMAIFMIGDLVRPVGVDETWSLRSLVEVEDVDSLGSQLVATGLRTRPTGEVDPMIWIRTDPELYWHASTLPAPIAPSEVLLSSDRVTVFGSRGNGTMVVAGTWDAASEESVARAAVDGLLHAFETGNFSLAWELLIREHQPDLPLIFPGLGGLLLDVWGRDDSIDPGALRGAIDYVTALDTNVSVRDCSASPTFSVIDTVRVVCDYTVTSSLLRLLGEEDVDGTLISLTQAGAVASIRATSAGEDKTLKDLRWFASFILGSPDGKAVPDEWRESVRADGDLATEHLNAAAALGEYAFHPGQTRVAESPLGTLEISWIAAAFGTGVGTVSALAWDGRAYYAAVRSESFDRSTTTLWKSHDGLDWTSVAAPVSATDVGGFGAFDGGLLAWGTDPAPQLWFRVDADWQELRLPVEAGLEFWVRDFVPSGERGILIASSWTSVGEPLPDLVFVVDADGLVRRIDLPVPDGIGVWKLAGHPDGFLLMTRDEEGTAFWHSPDADEWSLISRAPDDTIGWPISLAWYGGSFVLHTEGDWATYCGPIFHDGCHPSTDVWKSTTGEDWEIRPPITEPIELYETAASSLGLAAPSAFDSPFLLTWLSTDGERWAVPQGVLPTTGISGYTRSRLAIGDSGYLVAIMTQTHEESWMSLMIGRVLSEAPATAGGSLFSAG